MDRFEMTEKLRERAQVSYEEARAALEHNNWDLVDAIVYLENKGQLKDEQPEVREERRHQEPQRKPQPKGNVLETVVKGAGKAVEKGNRNYLEIYRNGERIGKPSLLVMVILTIAFPWIFLPGALIALVMGCTFRLAGPDVEELHQKREPQAE